MKKIMTCLVLSMLVLTVSRVKAETTDCTEITSVPTTISSGGIYCLKSSLIYSGPSGGSAIEITADNVTLDMNGHSIDGASAGTGTKGIRSEKNRNITIRNGAVRGFTSGIYINLVDNLVIEEIHADSNTAEGIHISDSKGAAVRNNVISDTTGAEKTDITGLFMMRCHGSVVEHNRIHNTTVTGTNEAFGVRLFRCDYCRIYDNHVSVTSSEKGNAYALYARNTQYAAIKGNTLLGVADKHNSTTSYGFYIEGTKGVPSSYTQVEDNHVSDVEYGFRCVAGSTELKFNTVTRATVSDYLGCMLIWGNT